MLLTTTRDNWTDLTPVVIFDVKKLMVHLSASKQNFSTRAVLFITVIDAHNARQNDFIWQAPYSVCTNTVKITHCSQMYILQAIYWSLYITLLQLSYMQL